MEKKDSRWKELGDDLCKRFISPSKHPEFIIYFIIVIIITSLLGIGSTIYIEYKMTNELCCHRFSHIHVALSIAAYFTALLTASSVDLILSLKSEKGTTTKKPYIMIGIGAIILGLCLMGAVIFTENIPILEYCLAILGLIMAWFIWWISNYDNQDLYPSSASIASLGGIAPSTSSSNVPNLIIEGDLSQFKIK